MDIEKATGIKNGNLSRWENGQVIPGINFCVQLAQYYGISIDELINLTDSPNKQETQHLPTQPQNKAVSFTKEYNDIIDDKNFINTAKLFNNITPELRALVFGYIVGLLQSNGIDTQKILEY